MQQNHVSEDFLDVSITLNTHTHTHTQRKKNTQVKY